MFSIKESFKLGWEKTRANFWKVVGFAFVALVPSIITSILNGIREGSDSVLIMIIATLLTIAFNVVAIVIGIGLMKIFLRMYDGENPRAGEILSTQGVFWKYLGGSILYALVVFGGIILFIIPGIVWAVKYCFTPIIIVDTKAGPITALKESGRLAQGTKWRLLGFMILSAIIVMAGYAIVLVGALVTTPIVLFAWVHIYRKLSSAKASLAETSSPQAI